MPPEDKIIESGDCRLVCKNSIEDALVIEGSPNIGLIGNIVGWRVIEDLGLKEIGYIESKKLPPVAVLKEGKALHPFRMYGGDDIVLFLSDFLIPSDSVFDITNIIVEWVEKNNSREVITISSVLARGGAPKIVGAGNNDQSLKRFEKLGVPTLKSGIIAGLAGTLLTKCKTKNIPASCIFAEVISPYPDPRAAANVIELLNKIADIEVDPQPLLDEAKKIESRLKRLAEKIQKQQQKEPELPIYL